MEFTLTIFVLTVSSAIFQSADRTADAQTFKQEVGPLIESSCIHCHDASTETDLNFETLGHDLTDADTFRKWESVFDRVRDGEMPPPPEDRPDPEQLKSGLASLRQDLLSANVEKQKRVGRVPARRLTKLEFGYTLQDLLLIDDDVTTGIPDEVESGNFDTIGSNQRISAVHMESYLAAADEALGRAINIGRNPYRVKFTDLSYLDQWHEKPINQGGSVTRKLDSGKGVALFADVDYLILYHFEVVIPGTYRLSADLAAYQSKRPVTAKFIVKDQSGGARLAKSIDLLPDEPQSVVFDTYLKPGDAPYLTVDISNQGMFNVFTLGGAKNYKGPGLAIMSQKIEGPIFASWPAPSTQRLFKGLELTSVNGSEGPFRIKTNSDVLADVAEIVGNLAPRLYRRSVDPSEIQPFVNLAKPAIEQGRSLDDVIRIPLRSMLTSPQFLMFAGTAGELDDDALANRLSYFFWKSMPDEELSELAQEGKLSDSKALAQQVDRLLADEKSSRFIRDFLGQWLRLYKVNATTPDDGLYPEFDELLNDAIPKETELFFKELIQENLSLSNLIDSDFTFLNRRLAAHYRIRGVKGQHFRKISLPENSPRGGVLTQAAILKTTANGTTTSPVMRGNFVLSNFFGTPPSPPPPGIGSIEPDTRGKTTIREILKAHRELESCNQCHREIDPPGFALESFDPIGGYRTHYRAAAGERTFGGYTTKLPPRKGPAVDPSGVTFDGKTFANIQEFKKHLLNQKEQIARNFISRLVVYSTGGEIEFADRAEIESILESTAKNDFPVRDIIHEVVQSEIFRKK